MAAQPHLSDEHDLEGLYLHGPRRAGTSVNRGSAAEEDAKAAKLEAVRVIVGKAHDRRDAIAKLRTALTGRFTRTPRRRRTPVDTGPWHPRFAPPGPAPYTAAQRDAARAEWQQARASGEVTPPVSCECCDRAGLTLHGHHTDYSKPLDVMWLCEQCHRMAHGYARPAHLVEPRRDSRSI